MSVPASRANGHGLEVSTSCDVVLVEHGDGGLLSAMTDVMNSYTTLDDVWAITVNVEGPTRFERYFSSQNAYGTPDASENRSVAWRGCA